MAVLSDATVSETIQISAPALAIYGLVADVTRMGEWSPEATGARVGATGPTLGVGDRFTGTNKRGILRWSTYCTVTIADPGELFEFEVEFRPFKISTWRYEFAQQGGETLVTESWFDNRRGARGAVIKGFGQLLIPGPRPDHNRRNMARTLANLKKAAEAKR